MFKRIFIIINPASGKDEPILSYINKTLEGTGINWEIALTKNKKDAFNMAKEAARKKFDLIAAYGGDGTIAEVAEALYKQKTPLLILPGGTANVMAKEMGIPVDTQEALKILHKKIPNIKKIDMGLLNRNPFILRLNIGIFADMVTSTARESKNRFGQFAYSASVVKHVMKHNIYKFSLNLDGKEIEEEGVALMIANAGNIGFTDVSIAPRIVVTDGFLDVILFKTAAVKSFMDWLKSLILGKKPKGDIKHWKAKKIEIKFTPEAEIVKDDKSIKVNQLNAEIVPNALTLVVP